MQKLILLTTTLALLGAGCMKGPTASPNVRIPAGPAPTSVSAADCGSLYSATEASARFGVPMTQTGPTQDEYDAPDTCRISFHDSKIPPEHAIRIVLSAFDAESIHNFDGSKSDPTNSHFSFEYRPAAGVGDEASFLTTRFKFREEPGNPLPAEVKNEYLKGELTFFGRKGWYVISLDCELGWSIPEVTLAKCSKDTYLDLARIILPRVPR